MSIKYFHSLFKTKVNIKTLFLIDAIGALVTTFFLIGILAQFEQCFGMPKKILYLLSGVAFCFFIYSISCHFLIRFKWKPFLILIMILNTLYSLISLALIIQYSEKLTILGISYFSLELIVIAIVVAFEYKTYLKLKDI